jgi:hypothetical protein
MSDTTSESEDKVDLYEHFFRDPKVGEGILRPPLAGIACRNIRAALRYLGYSLPAGDRYDDALAAAVTRFQEENDHTSHDGQVGPGTRRLLTRILIAHGEGFFKRGLVSPEYAVFLSYARKDEASLIGLVKGIQARGIPVFRDKDAIPAGASWPDLLYRSVQKCQVFLCMLSPNSANSVNVLIEVALARHAGRHIVPVMLQAVQLPVALRSLLQSIQHIDLSDRIDSEEGLAEVLAALSMYGLTAQAP